VAAAPLEFRAQAPCPGSNLIVGGSRGDMGQLSVLPQLDSDEEQHAVEVCPQSLELGVALPADRAHRRLGRR